MPAQVEQIFTDIGDEIYHGGALRWCAPAANPCRQAFLDHPWGIEPYKGRQSWDPLAVLVAVRGPAAANCTLIDEGGENVADEAGANYWTPPAALRARNGTNQSVLVLQGASPWTQERRDASGALEALLCQPPIHAPITRN